MDQRVLQARLVTLRIAHRRGDRALSRLRPRPVRPSTHVTGPHCHTTRSSTPAPPTADRRGGGAPSPSGPTSTTCGRSWHRVIPRRSAGSWPATVSAAVDMAARRTLCRLAEPPPEPGKLSQFGAAPTGPAGPNQAVPPEQIVGRLRLEFPDGPTMHLAVETIFGSLYPPCCGGLPRLSATTFAFARRISGTPRAAGVPGPSRRWWRSVLRCWPARG